MRVSISLTLWLVAVTTLVLAIQGWRQLTEEEDDLYAAAGRELELVTTAVRSSVENSVRDEQEADIDPLLEQLELKDPAFDVFVFRDDGTVLNSSGGTTNLERARVISRQHRDAQTLRVHRLPEGELASVAPLRADGRTWGRLVILRPPHALRADLRDERDSELVTIGALIVLLSVVIWAVVNLRLERPLSRIIGVVRRVAGGDLAVRIRHPGRDELAELSKEFDTMVEVLEETRTQLAREAETRERLEGEMLRANRLSIVGELAATLAHEVGSPLQVLGGRARDVLSRSDLPGDVSRSVGIIVDQVDRVHAIVERFLDVARRKAPVIEDVELESVVGQLIELLGGQTRRGGVRIAVDVPGGLAVPADPAQLQQVLLNLLHNALRASRPGDTVLIRAERSRFRRVPDGPLQPSVAISVEDEGVGIPDGASDTLFQPFFTAWSPEPKRSSGTGLGLSVVKTIVTDHGGIVEVHPGREGKGARFVVRFPTQSREELA